MQICRDAFISISCDVLPYGDFWPTVVSQNEKVFGKDFAGCANVLTKSGIFFLPGCIDLRIIVICNNSLQRLLLLYMPWKRLLWSSKLRLFLKDLLQMSQKALCPVKFSWSRCFSLTCLLALSLRGICFRQKRQRKVLSGNAWRYSCSAPQTPSD